MPIYQYKAYTNFGKDVTGSVEAPDESIAWNLLIQRGIEPIELKEQGFRLDKVDYFKRKVKHKEVILFTKQFRALFNAGVSITKILSILDEQTDNPTMKEATSSMATTVSSGGGLFDAFAPYENIFTSLYIHMIRAGETSGSLSEVMNRLVYILEHEFKIKNDIIKAMRYPKIVVGALFIAFMVLLTQVIPKFVDLFKSINMELPFPTRVAIAMYEGLESYWHIMLVAVVVAFIVFRAWKNTPMGRLQFDTILLHVPIIGPVLQKAAMARFASIFAILQYSGLSVLESLDILSETIGNEAISKEFREIGDKLREGRGISGPLSETVYFPPLVVNMVAIGEESGSLEKMLQDIASHYDDEVDYAVAALTEAIAPILLAVLSFVVGFFAFAIFMPMWDLMKMVK